MPGFFCLTQSNSVRPTGGSLLALLALFMLLVCLFFPAPAAAFWPFTAREKDRAIGELTQDQEFKGAIVDTTSSLAGLAGPAGSADSADNQALALRWEIAAIGNDLLASLADSDPKYGDLSGGVIVLSFVDQRNLSRTTSLGRYLAEQLMHELQQHRVAVLELRKSTEVRVQERGGEFGLSRNPAEIRNETAAAAILTGTYTVTAAQIIVNARIIDHRTTVLLASATAVIARTSVVNALLADPVSSPRVRPEPMYMQRLEL